MRSDFIIRLMDIVFSCLGLIMTLPLLIIISILIVFDSQGPVIFSQERVGRSGNFFILFKFRTMKRKKKGNELYITSRGDNRITRIGKRLRKYKLDELPQLYNVLRGEMSIVGPRPEVPRYVAYYTDQQKEILCIRPGITDLASLAFINEEAILGNQDDAEKFYINNILPQKIEYNLYYLRNKSPGLYLSIIFKTIFGLLNENN